MEKSKRSLSLRNFRFTRKTTIAAVAILLFVVAAGAFLMSPSADDAAAEPALQTSKVRVGDLVITANGAGTVIPAAQVDLGFRSGGMLIELNVSVGDAVVAGQSLARLDGNIQAEADFQALFTPAGVAQADGEVARAEIALNDAKVYLIYLISPEVYYNEIRLAEMQSALDAVNADPAATEDAKAVAQKNVQYAQLNLRAAQSTYVDEYCPLYFPYSWIDEISGEEMTGVLPPTEAAITLARADLESARVALADAQAALEIVKAGPEALTAPLAALGPQTAKLEQARLALESTRLIAPFDGTVMSLNAVIGQTVGTAPIMSVATTQNLLVRFYLDESDVDKVAAGKRVLFIFDAYPDLTVEGKVIRVEPALQTVDGTPVVVVWAELPSDAAVVILSGMTVDAEVIAGEAHNALIVPVQALREITPGSYAVFVVEADGQLKLTPVTVGLRDYANAEILSGLKAGDVVSTGTVETK
ncbi:MAG: Uncharacterized protein FD146_2342 [Anaerolineaceae bacterium]|nr:MAG: Uncharacterized protein FD146_2342 [Anaerolineaceae bacterium]